MLARSYAEALYSASRGKTVSQKEKYVKNLTLLLQQKGHIQLLPSILSEYKKILRKQKSPTITVARESDRKMIEESKTVFKEHFNDTDPEIRVNEDIIGGFRITSDARMFDASYKSALRELYRNMISSHTK